MREYIFDATVLSNFAAADRLSVLEAQYSGVGFTTIEVSDELRRGVKAGYEHLAPALQQIETVNPEGWLRVLTPGSADEHRLRITLDRSLDPGEASCLALAASRGLILATDDLAARRFGRRRRRQPHGYAGGIGGTGARRCATPLRSERDA